MADIFLSYSEADRTRVKRISHALAIHGFSVWWDREEQQGIKPGQDFDLLIETELKNAACVIVSWSEASRKSRYVRDEARIADKRGVIVPILLEQVEPPLGFASLHTEDLSKWDGDPQAETWQRVILQAEALTASARNGHRDLEGSRIRSTAYPINTTAYISIAFLALMGGAWFISVGQQMGIVGITLTLAFLAYTLFRQADQDLRPHMRALATRWLLPKEGLAKVNTPEAFLRLFEAVFGRRHFSWFCLWRSTAASMICYTVVFLLIDHWQPNEIIRGLPIIVTFMMFFVFIAPVNFIGDYVSLAKTRLLLHAAAKRPYLLSDIILFDAILTFIIFIACFSVLFPLARYASYLVTIPLLYIFDTDGIPPALRMAAFRIGEVIEGADVMWNVAAEGLYGWSLHQVVLAGIAAASITSIWFWMVLVFSPVVRFFVWSRTKGATLIGRMFDLKHQPFTALGFCIAVLILATGTTIWVARLIWV